MKEVVIVSGSRTAVGTFGGALKTVPAIDLGVHCHAGSLQADQGKAG